MKMQNHYKIFTADIAKYLLYISLAVLVCSLVTSCSVTHKSKSNQSYKNETASSSVNKNTDVKNAGKETLKGSDSSYTDKTGISIHFDNDLTGDNAYTVDPGFDFDTVNEDPVNDYAGAPSKPKAEKPKPEKKIYNYNVAGNKITSTVPIKNIDLVNEKTGEVKAIEITKENISDSSASINADNKKSNTEANASTSEKKTKSYVWIGIVIVCAIALAILYRLPVVQTFIWWFLALFGRRKKNIDNNLKKPT